jgi:NitT/TauT family transport system permease protein/putative hydroxymethylpyrimidine transport system permease protein
VRRWLLPTLLIAALIGAWQVATASGAIADALDLEPFLVPSPLEIAESLWQNRSLLAENAWVTLREVVLGLGIALLAGAGFAAVLRLSDTLRLTFYPLLIASQTIPIVVISPILVVWFGYGIALKLLIVALICFFPVTVNTLDGLRAVDADAIKLMRTLYASRWQLLHRVEAPGALPNFFTGAKIGAVIAPIGAVFAEWAGAEAGLGRLILLDGGRFEVARQFAAVVVLSAIALALYGLLALAQRRVVSWR